MIYYILMKHQDTDDIPTTDENTDKTNIVEAAKEAINAKAEWEEITLKFS